jgi:hypothetical protein
MRVSQGIPYLTLAVAAKLTLLPKDFLFLFDLLKIQNCTSSIMCKLQKMYFGLDESSESSINLLSFFCCFTAAISSESFSTIYVSYRIKLIVEMEQNCKDRTNEFTLNGAFGE